ncbi:4-hydroxy-tetrahydrodipicolinate synthase [Carboxylicivirga caseinilyticus]|uniref:4-hydroxy-tetrahydrodipicolinate synthase n=1 Tax=Carboxylicivirga caseinilyticus TaxID=3417572 RepID=UPI003D34AC85|nr:4-hydroxy-tetrahydrodipicolinate synthase [Marinilabiliaceae bacterium A049]
MLTPYQLGGTGVALVTPFNSRKEIDFESLDRLVHFVIQNQVDFLVALGTTSEASTLSEIEKREVVRHIIAANGGRKPIIVGMGGNDTNRIVDTINKTDFDGIDGILSVVPYYNKPCQEGIYQHFSEIAKASPVPIILYNVPGRTSSNINAETTIRLANDFENIIAVKEASGDLMQIMNIIHKKPDDFMVLSGDDASTLPLIALGADGVISVTANGFPFEFSQLVREALNESLDEACKIHYSLLDIIQLLFSEGNPAGIKALLNARGLIDNNLRLPLVPVTEETYIAIEKFLNNF